MRRSTLDAPKFSQDRCSLLKLIEADSDEATIQRFLEAHPHLLMRTGQGLVLDVASQLPLGVDFRADFAYWWQTSAGGYIRLIEIERPGLQLFTAGDDPTAEANHACQQLRDWDDYLMRGADTLESMIIDRYSSFGPIKRISYTLVMGRREQLSTARRRSRWRSLTSASPDIAVRTWDGFIEDMAYFAGLEGEEFAVLRYRRGEFHEYHPEI